VLVARREKELQTVVAEIGEKASYVVADCTVRADVQRVLDTAIAKNGHVDVWVNNAGRGITKSVADLTDDDFDQMMLVNVKSALYGMQVAFAYFKERKAGHILNVSSMLGKIPFASIRSVYCASKAALNSLTTNLRMDAKAASPDLHVTLVLPGVVATDFGSAALHGGPDSRNIPGAQPVEEVADVIADAIEHPAAEVYTRPAYRTQVMEYHAAPDLLAVEAGWAAQWRKP
jgi:short-subunit dehydrogenase